MFSRARFAFSLIVLLGLMSAGSRTTAQSGMQARMMLMHWNPTNILSLLDADESPNPGMPKIGKFISGSNSPARLMAGQAWPGPVNPTYFYGYTESGTIRRVGPTGADAGVTDFTNYFQSIDGATLVTSRVPMGANTRTVPSAYDLKEHYAIVGRLNPGNPSLGGNTAGLMLVDPATMAAYHVGAADMFYAPSTQGEFTDVCFCVWPGPDGNYDTVQDNEYRYVLGFQPTGEGGGSVMTLSLNFHETQNGIDGNMWNPITPERGPHFTHAYPRMDSNSNFGSSVALPDNAVPGSLHVRSYFLRSGIPNVDYTRAPAERSYVAAGWVVEYVDIPTFWRPWLGLYDLGKPGVTSVPQQMLYSSPPMPQGHAFCDRFESATCFKSLTIIGDWAFATIGETPDGFGDHMEIIYLPEMADGAPPTELPFPDDGHRGTWDPPAGTCGHAGAMINPDYSVRTTYLGTGMGGSSIYGTLSSVYQDWTENVANAGAGALPIDCHTEAERQAGANFRQAPQPFAGFYQSVDPVENFPGMQGGGGKGPGAGGGCSNSAAGGASAAAGAALLAFAALTLKVVTA